MNKLRLQEVMAKTSVAQSVCYRNHAGETIKKSFKKREQGRGGQKEEENLAEK